MAARVSIIRRRGPGPGRVWGWEITARQGPHNGKVIAIVPQTQLSNARFTPSLQTKIEGDLEYGQLDMANCVRVDKQGLRYHRIDSGELVTGAQGVWLSPMGNLFAIGLE